MQLFFVFGYPGSGKTYVSTVLQETFGFYHHDGDADIPPLMKQALEQEAAVTDTMRDAFFQNLLLSTKNLMQTNNRLVVSQTFLKDVYRKQFSQSFPQAVFLYVQTDDDIRNERLKNRKEFPLSIAYAQKMVTNFDAPTIAYTTIVNNETGKEKIVARLRQLVEKTPLESK